MSNETNIGGINISGVSGGTIQTGDITTHITAGGDVVGGDKITYHGPTYPRLNYRNDIADLLNFYTQTFSGREQEWSQLLRFTTQETPGYLLIEALPGYGKSALMAQLIHRHETDRWGETPRPELIFFFIRHEGQRHTPVAFLQAVNSQLLTMLKLPGGVPPDLTTLRSQFSELWSQALAKAHQNKPLLLLVDGFDELAPGEVTIAHLLPASLAPYVHVVISSRTNPAPLRQVPLQHPCRQADVIRLDAFDGDELRILLQQHGAADNLARALAPRVLAMTKGEPLFARFVCQEVAAEGESALARLEQNPPVNVEAYFQQQLEQLKGVVKGKLARDILGLLLVTLGGMTTEEIAEVLDAGKWDIDEAIEPIRRFLLGETKLELMHLQLRKVLAQQFGQRERKKYRQMLLTWCQSYRQQNWPKETPDYVLAHYAQHLVEAEEREALYALISKRWLALKIARTYSYHPFAEDVNLAIQIAKSEAPPNWVQLIRNCLTYATFISLAYFVPPTALGVLIRLGQTSRALGYAALMENLEHQSRAYNSIGQAFLARGEREEAITILKQALEKIEVIDEFTKVKELSDVIRTAVQARDKTILVYALAIAKEIRDEEYQLKGIYNVLQAFIEIREFEEALKAVEIIKDGQIRDTLRQMVQAAKLGLTKERKIRTAGDINIRDKLSTSSHASQILTHVRELDRILAIINVIPDEENKAFRLGQLAHTLAKMGYKVGLEQVLAIVQSIKNERAKAAGLTRLAQSFVIVKEFDKAVLVAESVENRFWKLSALSEVAAALVHVGEKDRATELVNRVLMSIEAIGYEVDKAPLLSKIAQALAKVKMLEQSLAVTEAIVNRTARVAALSEVARTLIQIEDRTAAEIVANQALSGAKAIDDEYSRVYKLSEVAQVLLLTGQNEKALNVVEEALTIAEAIRYKSTETAALNKLAEIFAQLGKKVKAIEIEGWALEAAENIENDWQRARQLNGVAQSLAWIGDRDTAIRVVSHALAAANAIDDEFGRAYPLMETAQTLAQLREFDQALMIAETIEKGDDKAFALVSIVQALVEEQEFDRALAVAETIELMSEKARALSEVACVLVETGDKNRAVKVMNQALAAAEAERHENLKVSALSKVAQSMVIVEGQRRSDEIIDRAMTLAMAIERDTPRAFALNTVLAASSQINNLEQALRILQTTFTITRLAGRDRVFEALKDSALVLAALDQGETLWRVYEAVMEVESWWGMQAYEAR